jgi:hypothetical protein
MFRFFHFSIVQKFKKGKQEEFLINFGFFFENEDHFIFILNAIFYFLVEFFNIIFATFINSNKRF